jgi:hypothetical protein
MLLEQHRVLTLEDESVRMPFPVGPLGESELLSRFGAIGIQAPRFMKRW